MYEGLPASAQRFVRRYITSIGQLEVFLLLAINPERWWTSDAVADELRTSTLSARRALRDLVSGYLVAFRGSGQDAVFRFSPADPAVASRVPLLSQLYRYRLTALVELIHGRRAVAHGSSQPPYGRKRHSGARDEASLESAG